MKQRLMKLTACFLAAGMTFAGTGTVVFADNDNAAEKAEAVDTDLEGQMVFAQCEEYINVRTGAGTDSEVVAKMYNNDSATIIGQEGDWYKIQSGNAVGYVKAEYFATGEEAEAIAEKVAYNVAVVHPDELNIRSSADTDSEPVGVAHSSEELEVVDYSGDWMKVALGNDVYGYVNAYYVAYKTYYPTAETLEEEQARLAAEQYSEEPVYDDWSRDTQTADTDYVEEPVYTEELAQTEAPVYTEEPAQTEPVYTEEPAQTEAPVYTEEPAQTEPVYTEEPAQTEPAYTEEPAQTEPAYTEEPAQTEPAYTEEPAQTEPVYTEEPAQTEPAASSSTGQDIANYALQFVGNPYVWGGTSLTNGADCSGFVQSVFANFGISLPRVAADQAGSGTAVDLGSIQAGDLLFYSGSGSGIDHVAIYIGGGSIVHASNPTSGITTSGAYYSTPVAAVRCW